jgi:hypothetical protein
MTILDAQQHGPARWPTGANARRHLCMHRLGRSDQQKTANAQLSGSRIASVMAARPRCR